MARGPKKTTIGVSEHVEVKVSKTGLMTIPHIKQEILQTLVVGTAILVCHKFDEKMRKKMEDKQTQKSVGARDPKVPHENFMGARYLLSDGSGDGIPAGGIKACIVAGARGEQNATMTASKGAITVKADDIVTNCVRILTPEQPIMRVDVCRNESGVADIRYRPQYTHWALQLNIQFLPSLLSASQVLTMLSHAGLAEGLCEWRPGSPKSRSGQWGTFRLANEEEVEAFEDGDLWRVLRKAEPKKTKKLPKIRIAA